MRRGQTLQFLSSGPSPSGRGCREATGEGANSRKYIPSSGPSGHLLPEGEGRATKFGSTKSDHCPQFRLRLSRCQRLTLSIGVSYDSRLAEKIILYL